MYSLLVSQPGEKEDSSGRLLSMCVIEEIANHRITSIGADDIKQLTVKQAVVVIGGLSVCRHHFNKILDYLQNGRPMTAVMIDALNGELV